LATREEVARLATREELARFGNQGERTRRYFDIVAERLEAQIRLLADGQLSLQQSMNVQFKEVGADIAQLDRRVTRLEAERRR
jgi:hypothetical protein